MILSLLLFARWEPALGAGHALDSPGFRGTEKVWAKKKTHESRQESRKKKNPSLEVILY